MSKARYPLPTVQIHTHSQNLNDRFAFDVEGPKVLHGRAWAYVHIDDGKEDNRASAKISWSLFGHGFSHTHLGINILNEDSDVSVDFGVAGLFSIYTGARWLKQEDLQWLANRFEWVKNAVYGCPGLDLFKLSLTKDSVSLSIASPEHWDSSKEKRRWFKTFDRLTGFSGYKHEDIKTVHAEIPLPEGTYGATLTFEKYWRENKRFPWWPSQPGISCSIDFDDPRGIPCPKGLYGMSCPATNVHEAVAEVVKTVIKSRGHTRPEKHERSVGTEPMRQAVGAEKPRDPKAEREAAAP